MFEVDNIEKYKELLLKANVKLIGDILNEAYGKLLTIEDPDGNWLEIFQNKPQSSFINLILNYPFL